MPERRCILSHASFPTERLVRLVQAPDGTIIPDIAAKLPGRGVWVQADGPRIREAQTKKRLVGAISRSLKTEVKAGSINSDLAAQIEGLVARQCLSRLGLEQRAGNLITGFDKIVAAAKKQGFHPALVFAAGDGAEDGRRKIRSAVGQRVREINLFSRDELSAALGRENVVHALLLKSGGAEKLKVDLDRLMGLRDGMQPQDAQPKDAQRNED